MNTKGLTNSYGVSYNTPLFIKYMREIKFRAWENGKMRYDFWQRCDLGNYLNSIGVFKDIKTMQFTGLQDKNGKDIYFDDIVKYKDESGIKQIGVVKDYGYFSGYIEAIGGDDEGNQDLQLHPDYTNDWEVIGNIYENPDLILQDK